MECECKNWACEDVNIVNLSGHHPRCPKYREIVYWDCSDPEYLTHTEMDDALDSYLSDGREMPETLEVHGYARMKKPTVDVLADDILERTLEDLDCIVELGSPDGPTKATEQMKAASIAFAGAILRDYTPWACEVVITHKINAEDWIKKNRPDWLEE